MGGPRVLRAINDRAALFALLRHGPLTRIELEQRIGLSKPAAAELLRRLERDQLVRRDGYRDSGGPGPNAQLWTVNPSAGYAAGVDVTPTRLQVGIADLTGTVVAERQVAAGAANDPVPALRRAVLAATRAAKLSGGALRRVVVGISGSIDPFTGELEYAGHMPSWLGFDVPARLSTALGMPVTVENDVNLVAIGESLHGSARGYRDVVLLWMGEGVAAGVIIDGRLHRGSRGGAGELDLAPIGSGGRTLGELLESTRVRELAARHRIVVEHGAEAVRVAVAAVRGEPAPRSLTTARAGRFLAELADRVTQGLVGAVALLDPELVVLGGDIGQAGASELAGRVAERLHELTAHRPEVRAVGAEFASVRDGAVAVAVHQLRDLVFGDPGERDHTEPDGRRGHGDRGDQGAAGSEPAEPPRVLADLGRSPRPKEPTSVRLTGPPGDGSPSTTRSQPRTQQQRKARA